MSLKEKKAFPRICSLFSSLVDSADRKRKLSVIVINIGDLNVNNVSDVQNVRGSVDSLRRDSGNVDKAVNVLANLCESAEGRKGNDLSGKDLTNLVSLGELSPSIHLLSLVSE